MTLGEIPQLMGPFMLLQLGSTVLGLVVAVVVAIRLVQGKPTHGLLLALPPLLPATVVLASVVLGISMIDGDPKAGIALAVGSRILGWLWVMPAVAITVLGAAVASLRAPDKQWAVAGGVAVLALVVVALPWGYGWPHDDVWPVGARTVVYGVAGVCTALAFAGRHATGGRDAAVAASSALAVLVGGGEMVQRALGDVGLLDSVPSPESVPRYLELANAAVFDHLAPWNHLTMLVALGPLVVAMGLSAREPESRVRMLSAAVTLLLAPALYLYGNVGVEALQALAAIPS